jgi:hypothetical protein
LIWSAIDLSELIAQIRVADEPKLGERVVIAFAARVAGTLVLLWADMISVSSGQVLDFRLAPPQAGLYLLLAAGLRLGVLPLHLPYRSEAPVRRGFGTALRMVSAASSLILLARIPSSSIASPIAPYLMILVAIAAVYGSWMWLRAPDELTARPFWLIGMGALAMAAALRGNPVGAAAWGCALVLSGGVLFLSSEPNTWLTRALLIAAFSALPVSLTAAGWNSGGGNYWFVWPVLVASHAMLIAGFVRHSERTAMRVSSEDQPIWGRNVYPIGIFLLLITIILLGRTIWMERGSTNRQLADRSGRSLSDPGPALAHPAFADPEPGPRALGSTNQHILARPELSSPLERVPPDGPRQQRYLDGARGRERDHVDLIVPGTFHFVLHPRDALT